MKTGTIKRGSITDKEGGLVYAIDVSRSPKRILMQPLLMTRDEAVYAGFSYLYPCPILKQTDTIIVYNIALPTPETLQKILNLKSPPKYKEAV